MAKEEKGEDMKEEKKTEKKRGKRSFFEVGSFILLIVLIIIVLIVVQVPYKTTEAVKEIVPVEKCAIKDIPFVASFKTGLNFDTSTSLSSLDGSTLQKYSELRQYIFANIRNTGQDKGNYCLYAEAYLITNFTYANEEDAFEEFQQLISVDSENVQLLDNTGGRYTYPVCTTEPIYPIGTDVISLWTPNILSQEIKNKYNLDNVYVLFTVVPPTSEQCTTVNEEQTIEEEVTNYCNAWKHLVGMC